MKILTHTAMALALLATVACDTGEKAVSLPGEKGNTLTLRIDTRSLTPGDGNALFGGAMNDLLLLVVDNDGETADNRVRRRVYLSGDDFNNKTSHTITFTDVVLGSYTVYAFGNVNTSSARVQEIVQYFEDLNVGDSYPMAYSYATFLELYDDAVPDVRGAESATDADMLINARLDVSVVQGDNYFTVELLRPLVNFVLRLANRSDREMSVDLNKLAFSNFNVNTSYFFSHDGLLPRAAIYRPLPVLQPDVTVQIQAGETRDLYDVFIYENVAPEYHFSMQIDVESYKPDSYTGVLVSCEGTSGRRYLYNADDVPALSGELSDAPAGDEYKWTLEVTEGSGSSGVYRLKNVANGKYLMPVVSDMHLVAPRKVASLPLLSSVRFTDDATSEAINIQLPGFAGVSSVEENAAAITETTKICRAGTETTAYLQNDEGVPGVISDAAVATSWTVTGTPVTDGITLLSDVSEHKMKVVDSATGATRDMTQMLRNSKVTVLVNVYYNYLQGEFTYELVPWEEISGDIVFE